ncbi:P-loop containing nucleoside triphosphate hydrolase protein [Hypoxylon rubiginosum]|uniref:P-loop containing nucleoside triphosphate hydrolase protein n=1 Tax=Hypoxylon rubiginosum TaxID=110542 RepID=A0ACB9Z3D3_9PEZI|nr:P-loop containing nucleoside triphosphate hydrolase protein [Hypoxylon rubiginosum]
MRYFSIGNSLASLLSFVTTRQGDESRLDLGRWARNLELESPSHETGLPISARPLFIFILGAPGVGKGTISAFLKTAVPGLTHLSYGDLTRYHDRIPGSWVSSFPRREGTNNPLLPADDAVTMLRGTIETAARQHGQLMWLVDGFPRRKQHVAAWAAQLPRAACTLYLFCPPEVSLARVHGRAATSGRPDDADEGRVLERVTRINAESVAMLEALEAAGMRVARVDASRDLETVKEEVLGHVQVGT